MDGDSHFTFVASTFERPDGQPMTLGDITLVYSAPEGEVGETDQNIWTLDLGGATKQDFYYVNRQAVVENWGITDEEEIADAIGWYADEGCTIKTNNAPMPYGQGFAVVAADAIDVQFNGGVKKTEAAIDIEGSSIFNFSGNVIPSDYVLGDLALIYSAPEGEVGETDQNIWTLDLGGATSQDYYYVNEQAARENWGCETEEEIADAVGWYSDEGCTEKANSVEIAAGMGFAIVSADDIQLWVPSPVQ